MDGSRVREALQLVFASEQKGYDQIVADLPGQQMAVLRALTQLGSAPVQSGEFLAVAGITHASSSWAAATRLVKGRILAETPEGLQFSTAFFRAWLLHKRY